MAIEILRPSASGDYSQLSIGGSSPAATNWQSVNEAVADNDMTYVFNDGTGGYQRDFHNLPASSGSGTINHITVYAVVKEVPGEGILLIRIIYNSTEYSGATLAEITTSYESYSSQWNKNPADDEDWEWADIDALQIGILLYAAAGKQTRCTQVYVEVDYTPSSPGWSGTMCGVSNVAAVNGVPVANISAITGVT